MTERLHDVRGRILRATGFDPSHRLVGGAGELDWWDDAVPLVVLGWELSRRSDARDVRLVWFAGASTDRMLWPLHHDLAHAGLTGRVAVVGPAVDPVDGLAAVDAVVDLRPGHRALDERVVADELVRRVGSPGRGARG